MSAFNNLNTAKNKLDNHFNSNYVELEDPENRNAGRKIFIAKMENHAYKEIINRRAKDFNSYYIYKQIVSLKNLGYLNSMVSKISMTSRHLQIEGGQIHYSVWQSKIYINSIKIQSDYKLKSKSKNVPAGIYKITKSARSKDKPWLPNIDSDSMFEQAKVVNTKNLAVNGNCEDILDASNYMPSFINHGYGESSLDKSYSLFFNPSQGGLQTEWKAFKDSSGIAGGTQAAKKLASVLMLSTGKNINITVQGNGNTLFKQALKVASQSKANLENMTVYYANSTENLNHVDHWRKATNMKLSPKAPLNNVTNIRQSITSGNLISQPIIAARANSQKTISIISGAAMTGLGMYSLGAIGTGVVGAAGWALGVAPLLLGQSKQLNKRVIETPQEAIEQGLKHYKKQVWDPVHKMMVKS